MSELMDALYEGLTGRSTDRDQSFTQMLSALVAQVGTVKGAAAVLGVHPDTVSRWRTGKQKPKIGAGAVRAALRRQLLKPGKERMIKNKTLKMKIRAWVIVSDDSRLRTIDVGSNTSARRMQNIVNAWLKGDDAKAERATWRAIDDYVEGVEIERIEWIDFM